MFGAALQTCLGSMFPTADTWDFVQLSPRLSDLLHVLSLAGTQQLGYLRGEGDLSGTGWETQSMAVLTCSRLAAFCIWFVLVRCEGREKRTLQPVG